MFTNQLLLTKKDGQIVLQKIIILISTFTHIGITQWCSQVVNIGEGASNQDKPTKYCDQGRRSVFDMGGGAIWWCVSTICPHKGVSEEDVLPQKLGKFVFF